MKNTYDKKKLQEALTVLEDEIREIESETKELLHKKKIRDGKQTELKELEQRLSEEKKLAKQMAGIERLISYAGERCSISNVPQKQAVDLENKCVRIRQELKVYEGKEAIFADAVRVNEYLQIYEKLFRQLWPIEQAAGTVQAELNQWEEVYLLRKDALGIGSRLLRLSEGVRAAERARIEARKTEEPFPDYLKTTAEMLTAYIKARELDEQGKKHLTHVLATLYLWLILLENNLQMVQLYFQRLFSLNIIWDKEECPAPCFEQFYELLRQNNGTLTLLRMQGYYQGIVEHKLSYGIHVSVSYGEIDVVKEYLDGVESGSERNDKLYIDMAGQILSNYIQESFELTKNNRDINVTRTCNMLRSMVSELGGFRGRPYFKEMENSISAFVKAYYDNDRVRGLSREAYREYLEEWMDGRWWEQDYHKYPKMRDVKKDLINQYPMDDLDKEIENCKSRWEILNPSDFKKRMSQYENLKKQIETFRSIIVKRRNDSEEAEIILEGISAGTKYGKKIRLIPLLVAVLVPLNILSMLVFEIILGFRFMTVFESEGRREKWRGRVNKRLNLIAATAMIVFYLTGGYNVLDFSYDRATISWLSFSVIGETFYGGMAFLVITLCSYAMIPCFAWSVFTGLIDLLKGMLKNERTKMR